MIVMIASHALYTIWATATDAVAWSVCVCVCVCVCLSVIHLRDPCKKRLNRSRCRLGVDSCGPKKQTGVTVTRIHSPPRGITRWRCGLLSKFFEHLLTVNPPIFQLLIFLNVQGDTAGQ